MNSSTRASTEIVYRVACDRYLRTTWSFEVFNRLRKAPCECADAKTDTTPVWNLGHTHIMSSTVVSEIQISQTAVQVSHRPDTCQLLE